LVRSEIYIACGVGLKLKVKVIIAMHFGLIGTVAFFCIFGSVEMFKQLWCFRKTNIIFASLFFLIFCYLWQQDGSDIVSEVP
jgi:hypothetical protein